MSGQDFVRAARGSDAAGVARIQVECWRGDYTGLIPDEVLAELTSEEAAGRKTKSFDLGRYAAGHSRPVKFDRPGIVRVFCDIHSHMNAFILVFSHPFFTLTDKDGHYRIDNVPPGTYNVIAWNEGDSSPASPVTVADGGTAELDFAIR